MRLSVLDLGSNSFHVLVADVTDDGSITPVAREREMLHLGSVVSRHGDIPDEERGQAVDVVTHLTALAERLGAGERLAVATSALREADNGPAVVAHMEVAADTTVRVIDGDDEARLAFLGVAAAVGAAQTPRLMLDLGGGSMELAVGTGGQVDRAVSLPVGVSRLSSLLEDDPPTRAQVRQLRRLVRAELAGVAATLGLDEAAEVVAIGGTIRALARVAAAADGTWWPATLNLMPLQRRRLKRLRKELVALDVDGRTGMPGMKSKRADHIHVAAVVVDTTLKELGIEHLRVSDWGLREGVLMQARGAHALALPQLRDREVRRMQDTFLPGEAHLDHVAMLAMQLFDATTDLHDLDEDHRALLEAGARLHGVGQALALRKQHHHGAYLVEHFELRGFSPLETAMLCCMARFHPTRGMSRSYEPWASMDATDARHTAEMVALLQVADGLDRARDQAVTHVDVRSDREAVELVVDGRELHVAVAEVQRRTEWFEEVFDVEVTVRVEGADG